MKTEILNQLNNWLSAGGQFPQNVEYNQIAAFIMVESGGKALDDFARPIIRFEVHLFSDYWGKSNQEIFNKHFQFNSSKRWTGHKMRIYETDPWVDMHVIGGQQIEWNALTMSMGLAVDSFEPAIQSASYGLGQVLGVHWKRLGYSSPKEFFNSTFDANQQIGHMIKFIETDPKLLTALQNKDWATVAKLYNGSGQVAVYSQKLLDAYNKL